MWRYVATLCARTASCSDVSAPADSDARTIARTSFGDDGIERGRLSATVLDRNRLLNVPCMRNALLYGSGSGIGKCGMCARASGVCTGMCLLVFAVSARTKYALNSAFITFFVIYGGYFAICSSGHHRRRQDMRRAVEDAKRSQQPIDTMTLGNNDDSKKP
jgi:hypothetical protein